jgi:hypothetical protein
MFDFPALVGGQTASQAQMVSVGFGLMGGNSHFTWNCGFRISEDEDKVPAKRLPCQSQIIVSKWVVQTRRTDGGFGEPICESKESVPGKVS